MSSPSKSEITVGSRVRILFGEHAGKSALVRGIGPSGHFQHDVLALELDAAPAPVFIFRFACQLAAYTTLPASAPARETHGRICRFREGDMVRVTCTALSRYGQTGTVREVHFDPPGDIMAGGVPPRLHARYVVVFSRLVLGILGAGTIVEQPVTFWDHELERAPEAARAWLGL